MPSHRPDVLRACSSKGLVMLLVAFALMTGAAILCALWPLSRRRPAAEGQARTIAFHKAQLLEIERDVERGQLPPGRSGGRPRGGRAPAHCRERRRQSRGGPRGRASGVSRAHRGRCHLRRDTVVAFGLYFRLGRPGLPDQPIYSRAADPSASISARRSRRSRRT